MVEVLGTRKHLNPFTLRTVRFIDGERFPLLCARATGVPLHEPMLYATTQLRATGAASLTMEQALRSVMALELSLLRLRIDLRARLESGQLFDPSEISAMHRDLRMSIPDLCARIAAEKPNIGTASSTTVLSLEKHRSKLRARREKNVGGETTSIRMYYVCQYIKFRCDNAISPLLDNCSEPKKLLEGFVRFENAVKELAPFKSSRRESARRGLTKDQLRQLEAAIDIESPDNPFPPNLRLRNYLLLKWMRVLGVRLGEVLNIRISDIDFKNGTVIIRRRPDSSLDSRKDQPKVKTRERELAVPYDLIEQTRMYVQERGQIGRSKKHGTLFVAQGTGNELSRAAVQSMFRRLRSKLPFVPKTLSAHVLRHTWNDLFSEYADKKDMPEAREKKARNRIMGWQEHSQTADTYTRRHTDAAAKEAILKLQSELKPAKK